MPEEKKELLRISVRNLVEFILREGDLDHRKRGMADAEAMQMGSRIHRKIQKRMGSEYQAEVTLKTEMEFDTFLLRVEGRADGIITKDNEVTIDEIKGTLGELEDMEEPDPIHLAQAKCYAWIYGSQNQQSTISVQMTYCQMETEEIKRFVREYSLEELKVWFQDVIEQYRRWAEFQIRWRRTRNASIKEMEFPYTYRSGQKELVTSVYRTILRNKKLFIEAPTGVGKTIATIFPAVKAVGEGLSEKVFYLTARTIARTVAEQTFDQLREGGLKYKGITLTAKEKICFCEKADCNPEKCIYAKGHFDRVNDAVFELLTTQDSFTREVIEEQAKKHQVCPFEMMLDLSLWVDAIICDYNYVFDPNVYLRRFFGEGVKGEYLFLIDEAHNLVERGRTMYSAELYKEEFLTVKKILPKEYKKLIKRLNECNKILLEFKKECDDYKYLDQASSLYLKLLSVMTELEKFLEDNTNEEVKEEVLEFYFHVRNFMFIYERLDQNYKIYTEFQEDGRFKIRLFCVNPAQNLSEFLEKGRSTIFFSATLLPIQYYKKLLSVEKDDYAIYAESIFDPAKRLLCCGQDVTTKYTRRSASMYERYAQYIRNVAKQKKGNYMAFFPSYQFMNEVYEAMDIGEKDEIKVLLQKPHMNERDREEFLEEFQIKQEQTIIGFCVMGGIFAEGINLENDSLIGAFIVGTGLPQVCNERKILMEYFDTESRQGFLYAYLYPGMNKVLQSAGRVIRTEDDHGIILLLDERFKEQQIREVFPKEWGDCKYLNLDGVKQEVEAFWKSV